MPKCLGQHRTIKIGASYWPISAICRSSSLKFCDFLRICFIWFLLIGNECFWVFLLYLFQQVHAVSEKNITHNSSPFWQGSPFRQEISKKNRNVLKYPGNPHRFFSKDFDSQRLSGCWWAHLCPVSDCHRGRPELQYELGKPIQCSICWEKYESQQDQQVGKAKHSKTLALNLLCWSFAKHSAFFFLR